MGLLTVGDRHPSYFSKDTDKRVRYISADEVEYLYASVINL